MQCPAAAHLAPKDRYVALGEGQGGSIGAGAYGRVYVGVDRLTQMQAMGIAAKLSRDGRRDGSMDGSRDGREHS